MIAVVCFILSNLLSQSLKDGVTKIKLPYKKQLSAMDFTAESTAFYAFLAVLFIIQY
ncbi:hypothetical protein E9M_06378 [Moraxella catarrhalis 46P47B1]|nr:hypothetical protein E9M_06378 [Moraxella catarrhalis 46P47B1]EGE12554.1 hypothetical protein E9G_01238 [Moraxella catarrhalis 7169]EGE17302.1 hypothetical protein E9Q_07554 [Moraxella catarrhalis BC1]